MPSAAELTTPLPGKPYYVNKGIIKAVDKEGRAYPVASIRFERFDDQNFQYVFTPFWKKIEEIPDGVFNGIPGINLDIKKDEYYRVNMTPAFVEMRSPSPGRADLWALMARAGLDYYDRFEWMLSSGMHCGDDNLITVRE